MVVAISRGSEDLARAIMRDALKKLQHRVYTRAGEEGVATSSFPSLLTIFL